MPGELLSKLEQRTVTGTLVRTLEDGRLKCLACAHECVLSEGKRGICGVRRHVRGKLRVPWGYIARKYVRPVETNTVFHVRPGALSLTFGSFGCDLRCAYCHNANLSQVLRDGGVGEPLDVEPPELVEEARLSGASVLCAAYNEPMISAEWVREIFAAAKAAGLLTVLISDGHSTPVALEYLRSVTDVFRVDLKGYSEQQYRTLGGRLAPVLESIRCAKALGYWVEVVTLVVPGLNLDHEGLRSLGDQLRDIDPGMPWHLNAFVPRYRMLDRPSPSAGFLIDVAGTAYARGSEYVYVSNVPGFDALSHTRCSRCRAVLVERANYRTTRLSMAAGACPQCAERIPGLY
jgi:pyruvate formate lyase activating enzyme